MKVILQHNVDQLGIVGDIVTVKSGYARNFLIPRGLALPASNKNLKTVEHHQKILEQRRAKVLEEAQDVATRIEGLHIELQQNTGEEGKLFGSVTSKDLEAQLLAQGVSGISRRQIALKEPIKQIGEYDVPVRIHTELKVDLKVTVTPTPDSPYLKKKAEKKAEKAEKKAAAEAEAAEAEEVEEVEEVEGAEGVEEATEE